MLSLGSVASPHAETLVGLSIVGHVCILGLHGHVDGLLCGLVSLTVGVPHVIHGEFGGSFELLKFGLVVSPEGLRGNVKLVGVPRNHLHLVHAALGVVIRIVEHAMLGDPLVVLCRIVCQGSNSDFVCTPVNGSTISFTFPVQAT